MNISSWIRLRLVQREHRLSLKFAERFSKELFATGHTATEVAATLAPQLGCPCCGPAWWRDIVVRAYVEQGEDLPPELAGVSN